MIEVQKQFSFMLTNSLATKLRPWEREVTYDINTGMFSLDGQLFIIISERTKSPCDSLLAIFSGGLRFIGECSRFYRISETKVVPTYWSGFTVMIAILRWDCISGVKTLTNCSQVKEILDFHLTKWMVLEYRYDTGKYGIVKWEKNWYTSYQE